MDLDQTTPAAVVGLNDKSEKSKHPLRREAAKKKRSLGQLSGTEEGEFKKRRKKKNKKRGLSKAKKGGFCCCLL